MIDWSTMPELMDRRVLRDRLGLRRADIDRIFDRCTEVRVPGSTKSYVPRAEVERQLVTRAPVPAGRRG